MNLKASDIYGEWYFKVEKVVVVGECVLRGVCVGGGKDQHVGNRECLTDDPLAQIRLAMPLLKK